MKTPIMAVIMATACITLTQLARANPPGRGGFSGPMPHFSNSAQFARPRSAGPAPRSFTPAIQSPPTMRYVRPPVTVGSHVPPSVAMNSTPRRAAPPIAARNAQNQSNRVSFAEASRRYDHARHDRDWWRRHYSNIVLVDNGYYFWDSGYWYPAWGYDPSYNSYPYDGPIYGFDGLNPDQVVADVQTQLQEDGYYNGAITGILDPATQAAIAYYQRDHNLAITSVVDAATVQSLGLS